MRGRALALAIVFCFASFSAAPFAQAEGRHPILTSLFGRAAVRHEANPQGVSAGVPSPYRSHAAVSGRWTGYGFGVPTYNWGYFGARYQPMSVCHTGYYNQFVQWGFRRGY